MDFQNSFTGTFSITLAISYHIIKERSQSHHTSNATLRYIVNISVQKQTLMFHSA